MKPKFTKKTSQIDDLKSSELKRRILKSSFILIFLFCFQNVFAVLTISANTDWDASGSPGTIPPTGPGGYQEGIVINAGKTLTITDRNALLSLVFDANVNITLGVGAKIEIVNSTLTTSGVNNWVGIVATGNASLEQFAVFPEKTPPFTTLKFSGTLNSNQTSVILTNSLIENAEIGVNSSLGAIVRTRGGSFSNCEVGIRINTYSSILQKHLNACFMMGTGFIWTTVRSGFSSTSFMGIDLQGVNGVNIGGCTFRNTDTNPYCNAERGIGINTFESEYGISREGNRLRDDGLGCIENCMESDPPGSPTAGAQCEFTNLKMGIKSSGNSTTKTERLGIRECLFNNNLSSIDISSTQHNVIFRCDFVGVRSTINGLYVAKTGTNFCPYTSSTPISFIKTRFSSQVRIVDNEIDFDANKCTYISVEGTGSLKSLIKANKIRNSNTGFGSGDDVIGIFATGNNSNLWIECNTFENLTSDITNDNLATLKSQDQYGALHNGNVFMDYNGRSGCYNLSNFSSLFPVMNIPSSATFFKSTGGSGFPTISLKSNGISCTIDDCTEMIEGKIKGLAPKNISLFPNPASNTIFINLQGGLESNAIIIISNSVGQELELRKLQSKQINISNLPDGILFLKIINGEDIYSQKFIKITN